MGSTAKHLTHPECPEITFINFQGACHVGLTIFLCRMEIAF